MNIISKIFTEESVINNEYFKIVADKYPICEGHIIAFSAIRKKCALKHDSAELERLLIDIHIYYGEPFYFYERGNASFCTSIDGPICSHLHFFPKRYFQSNLIYELNQQMNFRKLKSFSDKENSSSEYFMFGDEQSIFYIDLLNKPPKRFLRNYFSNKLL